MLEKVMKIFVVIIIVLFFLGLGSIYSFIFGNPIEKIIVSYNAKAILNEEYGIKPAIISFGYDTMRKTGDEKYVLRLKLPGKERFDEFVMPIKEPFDKSTYYYKDYIDLMVSEALSLELEEKYKSNLLEGKNITLNAQIPEDIKKVISIDKSAEFKDEIEISANIFMNESYVEEALDYQELFEIFQMLKIEYVKLDYVIIWFNSIKYGRGVEHISFQKEDFEKISIPEDLESYIRI